MTKRLGMFLGLGLIGVVLLLTGLAWDAVVHAHDPSLAGREGIFTLGNPGHALMGLGIGLVLVSLIGGCETVLSAGASGWWARPGVRQAFLTVSTVVVVAAAGITSWAAQAGHDHEAASHHAAAGHDEAGQLAAAVDGSHGHAAGDAAPDGSHAAAADGGGGAGAHDHPADGAGHEDATDAAGGDDAAGAADGHSGHPSTSIVHDHVSGPGSKSAAGSQSQSQSHSHDRSEVAGPAAPGGHDHGGAAGPEAGAATGGDHHHESGTGPSAADDAPAGTWTELRYGPFVITPAGAGGDADHANIAVPTLTKPCSNCFLQEFQPDLVYADGSSANLDTGMMLHHAVLFSAGRPDPTCGPNEPFPGKLGQRFFASGNERTPGVFPPGFGYYVDSGNWSGIFHIMNHSTEAKSMFFQVKVRWSPAAAGGIRPLTPIWLDMNNCRTSEYAVPAGPSSSHWTWTSTLTGRIVSTAGHVHDGGIRTTLSNQTTGEHLCTSWAGWGRKAAYQGSIESMSGCTWDRVGTVKKGEVLDLESVYDAPKPVPDAMGIMMAFVFETADLAAGTPAPPDVRGEGPPPVESTPPPSHHEH